MEVADVAFGRSPAKTARHHSPRHADQEPPNLALGVDRKLRGASTVGPHTAQPAPVVAPHDPPRQADACRSAIGRPISVRNISYLMASGVFTRVLALAAALYIPRKLGPESYGVLSTVMAFVALFGVFAFNGLNRAVVRACARDMQQARRVLELTVGLKMACSAGAMLMAAVAVLRVDYPMLTKGYIVLFSSSLLIQGLSSSLSIAFQAHEKLKYVALLDMLRQGISVPICLVGVSMGQGVAFIILVRLAAALITLAVT